MKTKHFIFSMLFGMALVSSCSDNNNVVEGTDPTGPKTDEPIPVEGFNYVTNRNVEFALKSQVPTVVSIYSDKACTANGLLVENLPVSNEAKSLDLNIPMGCNTLYVKYPTANGMKTAPFGISSALTRAAVEFNLPEDAVAATSEKDAGFTFYHNTGVVMFEDEWPEIARDNDYNDVVMEYDLKVTECNDDKLFANQGYKEGLLLTMDIRAVGGNYPTVVGLALSGLDKQFIDLEGIETRILRKAGQGKQEELTGGEIVTSSKGVLENTKYEGNNPYKLSVDTKTDNILIYLAGIRQLTDNGKKFYQVRPDEIRVGLPMLRAEVRLHGKLRTSVSDNVEQLEAYRSMITNTENQNFFIRTYLNREIHMRGYQPTYTYVEYADHAGEWTNESVKYSGANGFTWGMKLPAGTKHVQEKEDIRVAYPEYEKWVTSGGAENKDWYLHPDGEKVIEAW